MTRQVRLPRDPSLPAGASCTQSVGMWLSADMERQGLSNIELHRRLLRYGFAGESTNIISLWRHDKSAIALKTLPILLQALGLSDTDQQSWAQHFLHAELPGMARLLCRGGPGLSST